MPVDLFVAAALLALFVAVLVLVFTLVRMRARHRASRAALEVLRRELVDRRSRLFAAEARARGVGGVGEVKTTEVRPVDARFKHLPIPRGEGGR